MGITQSAFNYYENGLKKVAQKTKWKEGLIVNVEGVCPLIVYNISPNTQIDSFQGGSLIEFQGPDVNQYYVFRYLGDQIIAPNIKKTGKYDIFLRTIESAKIGGRQKCITPLVFDPETCNTLEQHPSYLLRHAIDKAASPNFHNDEKANV